MKIFELTAAKQQAWNDFVARDTGGTFFHRAEWKDVLERAFGLKTFYLYGEERGEITGVLPLALVKRPLFGHALISTPLCVYGGALGNKAPLEQYAVAKAKGLGVEYLELRNVERTAQDWPQSERFYTFQRALSDNQDENLKSIPRKQRAEVRKAIDARLETYCNQDIDLFYNIYSLSVRNLGTPIFAKKYLKVLVDVFGPSCEVTTIYHQGNPLTSVLSFKYNDRILPYYGGGLPAAREHSAYPFMYWKVMENAADAGFRIFDFGRSMKDSGAFAFKKNFGFDPVPLHYQYQLVRAKDVPDMDPDNPRNKFITSAWKKLPLPLANKIGPFLYPVIM